MKVISLAPQIFHVKFKAQQPLTKTFVRFQEYFESPHFRGTFFSLQDFRQWYIHHSPEGKKTGKFTFYQDLGGFNIPCRILDPFYQGRFNPLTREEKQLLATFVPYRAQRFYIIGTYGNRTQDVLQHEIAHGLFYTNPRYRKEVLHILHKIPLQKRHEINRFLQQTQFYHHDVWLDETHAYVTSSLSDLKDEGIAIESLQKVHQELNQIYHKYATRKSARA